ncbi:hypothetical protein HO133_005653 [Letharia lupina]|uniref:Uncharacterized protein n=1 Tax=Letharia lupina TaxID=560253 RepID=A0A8H6C7G6_9LECA|nr:uncharacterized protein HO133_005653 [Letharia lupina]KAF6218307.1 hypothetical protein HO133_005653 [Letharia lupina]
MIPASGVTSFISTKSFTGFFARLMDQRQQCDMYGYGYPGPGTQRYKGGDFIHEDRPYNPPERREAYEYKPMLSSLVHTNHGSHTGRRSLGAEVPSFQPSLGVSPFHSPYVVTSPETSDKYYAYSGNALSQLVASGYGSVGWAYQERSQRRNQEGGISDLMHARSEPISDPRQRYPDSISPYGSNTDWRPNVSPIAQMSASFNDALSSPYLDPSTLCANCGNHPHTDGGSVYHPDQRDVSLTADWKSQEAKNYFIQPNEEEIPSNRQLSTQDPRRIAPHNGRLDVPFLGQPRTRFSLRKSAEANAPNSPVTVHANDDAANKGLAKKRKRKPRTIKPRKPRTLTDAGKAHAKAVRDYPGGACANCKKKKTKCTHRLREDIPMEWHDKRTPNTPWTEPRTPEFGPGHHDPVLYRSSQENDFGYEEIG